MEGLVAFCVCFYAIHFCTGTGKSERSVWQETGIIIFSFWFWSRLFFPGIRTKLWLAFCGKDIAGITGASFTTASAYIADISTAENRAKNFGMVGAAFGLGFIIGPAIGGLLSGFGIRAPFYSSSHS